MTLNAALRDTDSVRVPLRVTCCVVALVGAGLAVLVSQTPTLAGEEDADPPEVGRRRAPGSRDAIAQHFFANCGGDVNARDVPRDPVMDRTVMPPTVSFRGPFAASDELSRLPSRRRTRCDARAGLRTYADFAAPAHSRSRRRSHDHAAQSPTLVGRAGAFAGGLLHSRRRIVRLPEDLGRRHVHGRNFGWLRTSGARPPPHRTRAAPRRRHGPLARSRAGNYAAAAREGRRRRSRRSSASPGLPVDDTARVGRAGDARRGASRRRLPAIARLHPTRTCHAGSAYGRIFCRRTGSRAPLADANLRSVTPALRTALARLTGRSSSNGRNESSRSTGPTGFVFRQRELRGLRCSSRGGRRLGRARPASATASACHAPPRFTDFRFHAVGREPARVDRVTATARFLELPRPGLTARAEDRNAFLPATPVHPAALGPFASIPAADRPGTRTLGSGTCSPRPGPPGRRRRSQAPHAGARERARRHDAARPDGRRVQDADAADLGQSRRSHDGSAATRETPCAST